MSGDINVINRSQTIKVDPTSGSIAVINAGPAGPGGPPGPAGSGPLGPIVQGVQPGPFVLPQGNYAPIPGGGISRNFALTKTGSILVIMTAYVDNGVTLPNEIDFAVTLKGANTSTAGQVHERILRCGGRTSVSSTFSMSYVQTSLFAGTTYADLLYKAQAGGANASDISLTVIAIPS